jgi:hypothetical protein
LLKISKRKDSIIYNKEKLMFQAFQFKKSNKKKFLLVGCLLVKLKFSSKIL